MSRPIRQKFRKKIIMKDFMANQYQCSTYIIGTETSMESKVSRKKKKSQNFMHQNYGE